MAMPNSLSSSLIITHSHPWAREGGRVNARGSQRVHKETESIVPMGRWGHSKDRFGERVDRDDLGSGERTEGAYVPKDPGGKFATSGEDRRGSLTS
jgi:hypothetical protein